MLKPGTWKPTQALRWVAGTQALRSPPASWAAVLSSTLSESWTGSKAVRTLTGTHVVCQPHKWWLNPICHHAIYGFERRKNIYTQIKDCTWKKITFVSGLCQTFSVRKCEHVSVNYQFQKKVRLGKKKKNLWKKAHLHLPPHKEKLL